MCLSGSLTVALALLLLQSKRERVKGVCLAPFSSCSHWRFVMLPPFIIEQIRHREEQERVRHEQPQLEVPIDRPSPRAPKAPEEKTERGVIIIDLSGD
jgi:hypothetical protein